MISLVLDFFGQYLIEFMLFLLVSALFFRYAAYLHCKDDEAYFSKFTREIEVHMEADKTKNIQISDIDEYLTLFLGKVNKNLPHRSLRFSKKEETRDSSNGNSKQTTKLRDYVGSKHGLIASIQSESNVFTNTAQPNFTELTHRVLAEDKHWNKLLKYFPLDGISRMIDILPSLFIVFGVFGTFIGISMALPEIAKIDFNNLEGSSATLTNFVINVTFAMKTSIAGIFFSIILTLLNTLFPIKSMRYRVFKKVEESFQMLWYHIHGQSSKNKNEEKLLGNILEVMKGISEKLDGEDPKKQAS